MYMYNFYIVLKNIQMLIKEHSIWLEQTLLSWFCVLQNKMGVRFLIFYLVFLGSKFFF